MFCEPTGELLNGVFFLENTRHFQRNNKQSLRHTNEYRGRDQILSKGKGRQTQRKVQSDPFKLI